MHVARICIQSSPNMHHLFSARMVSADDDSANWGKGNRAQVSKHARENVYFRLSRQP